MNDIVKCECGEHLYTLPYIRINSKGKPESVTECVRCGDAVIIERTITPTKSIHGQPDEHEFLL